MSATRTCSKCGVALPPGLPLGLCPTCLLGEALDGGAETGAANAEPIGGRADDAVGGGETLPRALGDFELIERIGQGGMGVVYKARHKRLGSLVAMKVMGSQWLDDPQAVARFQREMLAVGRLQHKHVVRARDARQAGGTLILITEFVDGVDLAALVRARGPLPVAACCSMIRQERWGCNASTNKGWSIAISNRRT